jgi:hypothetical protein
MPEATKLLPTTLTPVITGTTFNLLVLVATAAAPGGLDVVPVAGVAEVGTAPRAPDIGPVPSAPEVGPLPSAPEVGPLPRAPEVVAIPKAPDVGPVPSVPEVVAIPRVPEFVAAPGTSGVVANRKPAPSRLIANSLAVVVMDFCLSLVDFHEPLWRLESTYFSKPHNDNRI